MNNLSKVQDKYKVSTFITFERNIEKYSEIFLIFLK